MPHDSLVRDMIQSITARIALALCKDSKDLAIIKSYNKLIVYDDGYDFEIVVRLPLEPHELEGYRKIRKLKQQRQKQKTVLVDRISPGQHGSHIDSMPVQHNAPAPPRTKVDFKREAPPRGRRYNGR